MRVEYIPENEAEKAMMEMIIHAPDKANEKHTFEERLSFIERQLAGALLRDMVIDRILHGLEEGGGEDEEDECSLVNDIEMIKRQINVLSQTTLELEEYKVRLRNTESDLRQALEKISTLEQKFGGKTNED